MTRHRRFRLLLGAFKSRTASYTVCDTVQMCGKTQAPADLASSRKASASSEVRPAFEVLECRPGYHRSESPYSVGKPALNLRCSRASETD
ncbi:hypothetical protein GBF38_010052 [Nibea albiflora]|uniref:Uncharacterized protein n=1 Tax=Nibea albiflora TaxID=240163 RepID=A0ACB7F3K8_NIBAL|nr:hypothetical protein GBF38_010052 [Nibea albiflora]